jgi:adenylate cyclase
MTEWPDELAAKSTARIREYDRKRKQYELRAGKTLPDLDDLQIGESRQFRLAVLSVDIRKFTDISWGLNEKPLVLARLQALYLSEMSAIIRDRGGVTEKYTGDGVIGLFGTEADTEGTADVLNSLKAALDVNVVISGALNPFYRSQGIPEIRCGQGIDYGQVLMERVGFRGENQFSLSGLTVSFAAKLQGAAAPGQILVGEDVKKRISGKWTNFVKKPPDSWKYKYPAYLFAAEWSG